MEMNINELLCIKNHCNSIKKCQCINCLDFYKNDKGHNSCSKAINKGGCVDFDIGSEQCDEHDIMILDDLDWINEIKYKKYLNLRDKIRDGHHEKYRNIW